MSKSKNGTESFYSYSAKRNLRKEEIAAYKRIGLATIVIVGLLAGGYFIGLPMLARMGGDDISLHDTDKLGTTDSIPPTSPKLESLPEATRVRSLTIKGSAESDSTVKVFNNDKEIASFVVGSDGLFQGDIELENGNNSITVVAEDAAGNTSRATKAVIVAYDTTAPRLSLTAEPNSTVSTASATFKGKTEAGASVTVNDRALILADDNSFETTVTLNPGGNSIAIVATDKAGNASRITRTITYSKEAESSPSATPN